jgi:hypothetical protein
MEKENRSYPRVICNINAHIFYEQYIASGTILDLSCWGARVKSSCKLEELEYLRINFVFDREYNIMAYIVEELNNEEYRVTFTFENIADKLGLKYAIESYISK